MRRWLTSANVPTTPARIAAVSPAAGLTSVASSVTVIGPTMNTVSSTTASTANAVCSSRLSGIR